MNEKQYEVALPNQGDEALQKLVDDGSSGFLGRISQQYGVSDKVTEGIANVGEFWLGNTNLGKTFSAVVGPYRSHATLFEDKKLVQESYDGSSEVFQKIQKKQSRWAKGAKAGPEFLFYLPDHGKFATLQFARTTLECAPEFGRARGALITVGTRLVKAKNNFLVPTATLVKEVGPSASEEDYQEALEQFMEPIQEAENKKAAGSRPR